jgi:hypothetical protein
MANSRNRVIYQSESLYISKAIDSVVTGQHHELIRVQSANYGFTINRQDVNQYGNLARIDSLVLEPPTVNFDYSYYLGDGLNEKAMGFDISAQSQFGSGHLETSSGRNFYIVTSNEGIDAVDFLNGDGYSAIGVGNAFLSDYTVDLSVGAIPTVTASFEASNINSINGSVTGATVSTLGFSGELPSVDPELGEIIPGNASIRTPKNTGDNGPTALRPGDITLNFPGFDGGASESGTLTDLSGAGGFHVQSASLSVPLSRTPIEKVGSKFPFARVVDFPANASLTVNAVLNTVQAGNLANIIAGCGEAKGKEVEIIVNTCEGPSAIKWTLKGATLDSESFSSSIGSNKTVDLTFGVQLGGVNDTSQGILCDGAAKTKQVFPG